MIFGVQRVYKRSHVDAVHDSEIPKQPYRRKVLNSY